MGKLIAAMILILAQTSFAQGIAWVDYSVDNSGLLSDNVHAIVVDSANNKWFGTGGGLCKFNGTNWTTYTTTNSPLPSNYITCLSIAPDGVLWVGTSDGLASYDGMSWHIFNMANSSIPDSFVTALKATRTGVWVGAMDYDTYVNGGLAFYDGSSWTVYKKGSSPLPDNRIMAIDVSRDSTVWIGTLAGLARLKDGKWNVFQMDSTSGFTTMEDIEGVAIDSSNTKWLASKAYPELSGGVIQGGLLGLKDSTFVAFTGANSSFPSGGNSVNCIFVDKFNNVWVGLWYQDPGPNIYNTWGVALGEYLAGGGWRFYQNQLVNPNVQCITMDKRNHLWVGTQFGATEMVDSTLAAIRPPGNPGSPRSYQLLQNFPNPFNPTTMISSDLPRRTQVTLTVFDLLGRNVKTLVKGMQGPGRHSLTLDATGLASGVYFYRLEAGTFVETKKLTVLK